MDQGAHDESDTETSRRNFYATQMDFGELETIMVGETVCRYIEHYDGVQEGSSRPAADVEITPTPGRPTSELGPEGKTRASRWAEWTQGDASRVYPRARAATSPSPCTFPIPNDGTSPLVPQHYVGLESCLDHIFTTAICKEARTWLPKTRCPTTGATIWISDHAAVIARLRWCS
jgi:hypothetical protein